MSDRTAPRRAAVVYFLFFVRGAFETQSDTARAHIGLWQAEVLGLVLNFEIQSLTCSKFAIQNMFDFSFQNCEIVVRFSSPQHPPFSILFDRQIVSIGFGA